MNVILLGLPGAGKGTQAKSITDHLHVPHISTGDLFRKALKDQTELGLLAKEYMSKGELVPDAVTIGLALQRLNHTDSDRGFLLDGFPRNVVQADALEQYLKSQARHVDHVIYVEVDESILLDRLTGRRVCSGCGASFHMIHNPSAVIDRCDSCNGMLIHREDDQEATVKERLRINKELTDSLTEYYTVKALLRTIDGSQDISVVSKEILDLLTN
ncbi:adenylate kinase [Paenibacillus hemerocallicola]|uniref:Adenylate kinase n=1 Tax=Paenibacillus hemerocallicola TaxID=1172614 RepID=A0A5C4TCS7_9BACL|nr:adenylate kinase [Paenibacillus hemerocallicola]TNJ66436.1 adenylate kinase [Paenibacillus hemerocallicola]